MRATVLAIADELTEHGLVLRYRVDETEDGLTGKEGTFTICSFWLVSALSEIGERKRARKLCERVLSPRDPAGPLRGGDRGAQRRAARQLPAGVHPSGADQRRLHVIADEQMGEREEPSAVFTELRAAGAAG